MRELRGEGLYRENEDEHAETEETVEAEHVEGVLLHGCCADEVAEEFQHQHRQEVLRLR